MDRFKILCFGGSLRKGSFNKYLLQAASRLVPDGVDTEYFDLSVLPFFNQDDEEDPAEAILEFKRKIEESDAVLISTPEYNFSIPGYLKNALEIGSRFGTNSFEHKPVAIMSASMSMLGGVRAQTHLRDIFVGLDARVINKPQVFVSFAHKKFDEDGELHDEDAKMFIVQLLQNLVSEAELLIKSA